jgi:hypothetical protein
VRPISVPERHLCVNWLGAADGQLTLHWIESGGATKKPRRKDFGTSVVEQTIQKLKGEMPPRLAPRRSFVRNRPSNIKAVNCVHNRAPLSMRKAKTLRCNWFRTESATEIHLFRRRQRRLKSTPAYFSIERGLLKSSLSCSGGPELLAQLRIAAH